VHVTEIYSKRWFNCLKWVWRWWLSQVSGVWRR